MILSFQAPAVAGARHPGRSQTVLGISRNLAYASPVPVSSPSQPSWAVTPEKVAEVVRRLIEVGRPRKVYLFGSHVNGQAGPDSDLDVLVVVEDGIQNPRAESVRLRHALRGILMSVDILVVPESFFNLHRETPGLIYREVVEHGQLVYDSAR
jgi:predicted nucleotidyltransferase